MKRTTPTSSSNPATPPPPATPVRSPQNDATLAELRAAHRIIRNALAIMSIEQKSAWTDANVRDGVSGEGITRANEREAVIAAAEGSGTTAVKPARSSQNDSVLTALRADNERLRSMTELAQGNLEVATQDLFNIGGAIGSILALTELEKGRGALVVLQKYVDDSRDYFDAEEESLRHELRGVVRTGGGA